MTIEGRPTPSAPTLEAVAAAAGVSRATVSRVVNGSPKVRPEAVALVQAAIEALNYVPNRAARSLASKQMHAVALVVPEDMTRFFGDPYFAAIVAGITRRLLTACCSISRGQIKKAGGSGRQAGRTG